MISCIFIAMTDSEAFHTIMNELVENKVHLEISTKSVNRITQCCMNELNIINNMPICTGHHDEHAFEGLDDLLKMYKSCKAVRTMASPKHQLDKKKLQIPNQPEKSLHEAKFHEHVLLHLLDKLEWTLFSCDTMKLQAKLNQEMQCLMQTPVAQNVLKKEKQLIDIGRIQVSSLKHDDITMIAKLIPKNIAIQSAQGTWSFYSNIQDCDTYTLISFKDNNVHPEVCGFREFKRTTWKKQVPENLKKLLVKDLKQVALDLGIPMYKEVAGKKISLVKEELATSIQQELLK